MSHASDVFFLPILGRGQRFVLHHHPTGTDPRGVVVYVHPFAEEMNKSRRMAALQSRALAVAGYAVLQIDLLGCGDSSGDFGDATWDDWVTDVVEAVRWMRERHHDAPLTLWGLRAGCLLATAAAQRIDAPADFLFWQPAAAGKLVLQQFLRLKLAAEMQGGAAKGLMEQLRAQLAAGEAVDVAGYRLSPALAAGLESATIMPPAQPQSRVTWLEVSTREDATLLPASTVAVAGWRNAGHQVTTQVIQGPAFWQTAEIEESPTLIAATVGVMSETVTA
jgi:exosortase A-associated hydrolase 2